MSCKVSAKCKLMMTVLSLFVNVPLFASFSDGRALGGMPKKCIGLYFDVMNTTPSNADYPFRAAEITDVTVRSGFWLPRIETNRLVTIKSDFKRSEETGRIYR